MPEFKAVGPEKTLSVDDGHKRGPLTMVRLRFHPTQRFLLGQCVDRRLAVWDADAAPAAGKKGASVPGRLACAHDAGWIRGFDVHPAGQTAATGGSDRRLRLWRWDAVRDGADAAPAADAAAHDGWVEAVAYSPDGARIATVGADRRLRLWNAADLSPLGSAAAHDRIPRDVAFTPDGRRIVTAGEDGAVLVWDAAALTVERAIDTGTAGDQQGQHPAVSGLLRIAVSRDGRWLAASADRAALVYETGTGRPVGTIADGGGDAVFGRAHDLLAVGSNVLRLSAFDPAKLAAAGPAGPADAKARKPSGKLPPWPGRGVADIKRGDFSLGAAFSADDARLAAGRADGTVELWGLK